MRSLVVQDLFLKAAICLTFSVGGCQGGCFLQLAGARDKVETRSTREEINIKNVSGSAFCLRFVRLRRSSVIIDRARVQAHVPEVVSENGYGKYSMKNLV